ncbi:1-phosphofructokinase [Actinoplanes teichomyceticus]|uniref:1-phosphofructokinase n=1 Tax=Actinoplanes teichomyceticus TaxID=1867 RepID=A0A561VR29_ACTTI|nr:1-phosphofructokinase [Actinoplanes teichomyceticus]TWG14077.1 fructose-1-phosphate kinase [Actinoplanes teichomyceticus]GIF13364.1 1-phosphofructokinase [Actinoplanes teichomyceticus]
MILTVTLNPSVDRALEVDALVRGEVLRAGDSHIDPGGKGVNVSRALLANGVRSTAVVPTGGAEGEQLVDLLRAEGVDMVAVPITGRTRSNITLAEPDGTVTKINEAGPVLSTDEFAQVSDAVLAAAQGSEWVVICGSLPPGPSVAAFAALCERLVAAGARLAVDSSGPALLAGVNAGATLVKPNREELAEAAGAELTTLGDVLDACERLRKAGAGTVLASLGADGAVLVEQSGVLTGKSPVSVPRSTVGAGDAMLAGFLAAGARGEAALIEGLAWGAAAVSLPGSRMPRPQDLDRTTIRIDSDPDPSRPLGRD